MPQIGPVAFRLAERFDHSADIAVVDPVASREGGGNTSDRQYESANFANLAFKLGKAGFHGN
jgi:hypothetical protein